jgi:hypothetical protein
VKRHPIATILVFLICAYLFGPFLATRFLGSHLKPAKDSAKNRTSTPTITPFPAPTNKASVVNIDKLLFEKVANQTITDLKKELEKQKELLSVCEAKSEACQGAEPATRGSMGRNSSVLVGISSSPASFHRRSLIRATYLQTKPVGLDVVFLITGNQSQGLNASETSIDSKLLALEAKTHSDIVFFDSNNTATNMTTLPELMKLLQLGSAVNTTYKSTARVEDSVFLHLENFYNKLTATDSTNYFITTAHSENITVPAVEVFSKSVVGATLGYLKAQQKAVDDAGLLSWLKSNNNVKTTYFNATEALENYATSNTTSPVLVLNLRNDTDFINASYFLLGNDPVVSSKDVTNLARNDKLTNTTTPSKGPSVSPSNGKSNETIVDLEKSKGPKGPVAKPVK